jgi:predicted lipoprotein with Yx(FWY)xxD motif
MKPAPLALALALAAAAAALAPAPASAAPAAGPTAADATAPTLVVRRTQFGPSLFTGSGRVLYAFTRDGRNQGSRCYGDCARAWPVYYARGTLRVGTGLKRSLLGTTKRRDGRLQVTYNGWPLYTYAHEAPGEVKCHRIVTHGGTWLVVAPSGATRR